MRGKILGFPSVPEMAHQRHVGWVHPAGSITFKGRRYCTLQDVSPEWRRAGPKPLVR